MAKLLKQQSIEVLHIQLKAMFDCADDTLFDWARRAAGEEQHRCMSLMRLLRVEKNAVVDGFFKNFAHQFDHPISSRKASVNALDGELSMQPTDALEESIAISNMTARAEGMFRDELFELSRRLDWAIDHCNERVELHPIEPQSISAAFLEASRVIEMDIESRLVVLKLFERTVVIQLGDLYKRLLGTLDENGVQPSAAIRPKEESSAPSREQDDGYQPTSQISSMLNALGAMAGGLRNKSDNTGGNANVAPQGGGYPPPAGGPANWAQSPGASGMPPPAGYYGGNYAGSPGAYSGTPPPSAPPIGAYGRPLPQGYAAYAGYTDA
ncbi:MAG: DUF1631 family protein, partial [Stenotrophobium sp.]